MIVTACTSVTLWMEQLITSTDTVGGRGGEHAFVWVSTTQNPLTSCLVLSPAENTKHIYLLYDLVAIWWHNILSSNNRHGQSLCIGSTNSDLPSN